MAKTPASKVAETIRTEGNVETTPSTENEVKEKVTKGSKETVTTSKEEKKVTSKALSASAAYMSTYIERYLSINKGYLDTPDQRYHAIVAFRQIMTFAISNPENDVLDMVVKFFKENRNVVLSEELALQGITELPAQDQMMVSVFYRLFYDYTNPNRNKKKGPDLDQVRDIFKSDAIVNYCSVKFA